ncbi:MAG: GNAT family N-acetyltransferase, partial [Anaerovoracaceae bacterium]
MKNITTRTEIKSDYREVEMLVREAFWNQYVPGCDEHYFLHQLRKSEAFIPDLALLVTSDSRQEIIAAIHYAKGTVINRDGKEINVASFGPVAVLPEFQKQGIGEKLINQSLEKAKKLGYEAVIIFGNPAYYKKFGFQPAVDLGIFDEAGNAPKAMQVLFFSDKNQKVKSNKRILPKKSIYKYGFKYKPDLDAFAIFDAEFPKKEKAEQESQKFFAAIFPALQAPQLKTERLTLKSWELEDAEELFNIAKNPDVGPHAGWPPHT